MTDRLKGVVVVFEQDYRDDDAESLIEAIKHLRGVADARPILAEVGDFIIEHRVRMEAYEKLTALAREILD